MAQRDIPHCVVSAANFWHYELSHLLYSPALALYDFFMFPRMKSKLRRRRFQIFPNIWDKLLTFLQVTEKFNSSAVFNSGRNTVLVA
jgi:hypothetical protein